MQRKIEKIARAVPDAAEAALAIEGELILTDSKQNYVPVDFGVLRASGYREDPIRKGKVIKIRLAFGGAASKYAIAVHEHPSEFSPPSWKGQIIQFKGRGNRGHKYLEQPLMAAIRGMSARIAARIEKSIKGAAS